MRIYEEDNLKAYLLKKDYDSMSPIEFFKKHKMTIIGYKKFLKDNNIIPDKNEYKTFKEKVFAEKLINELDMKTIIG